MDNTEKIKVLICPSDNQGVGHFRSIWPAQAIQKYHKDEFEVTINTQPDLNNINYFKNFDIIHFHRHLGENTKEEENFKKLKDLGITLIMDIDDYWEPFAAHPLYQIIQKENISEKIKSTLGKVDFVTTTTGIFANEIKKLNKNVHVIPNAVDPEDKMWKNTNQRLEGDERCRIAWVGGSCYDKETEILTNKGFKFFKDLDKSEKVACLNPVTNKLEFHQPEAYIKEKYTGKLNHANTDSINYAVTPNHKMYVCLDESKNYQLIPSEKVHGKNMFIKKTSFWKGIDIQHFIAPKLIEEEVEIENGDGTISLLKRKKRHSEDLIIPIDSWLKLFALWIKKGNIEKTKNSLYFYIDLKTNTKELEDLFEDLTILGLELIYVKEKRLVIIDKRITDYLTDFINKEEISIPNSLLNLTPEKLKLFLNWSTEKDKDGNIVVQSKQFADNIQEICLKLNIPCNITNLDDKFIINTKLEQDCLVVTEQQTQIDYDDYVYCVQVPHNIILTRREGKAMWCGNSHYDDLILLEKSIKKLYSNKELDNKFQLILCGFDTRGTITEINQFGKQTTRPILPYETVWNRFESIFTGGKIQKHGDIARLPANEIYAGLTDDKEYLEWLYKIERKEPFNVLEKKYVRRWTLPLTQYAKHYDYCDVCLAPLNHIDAIKNANGTFINKENIFNKVKSELKIIEAGMKKKTLIAQDFGIYSELIKDGVNGILIPTNKNEKEWYKALKEVINNKDYRENLANNLHEFVLNNYNLKTVTKNRVNFYKQIMKDKKKMNI